MNWYVDHVDSVYIQPFCLTELQSSLTPNVYVDAIILESLNKKTLFYST